MAINIGRRGPDGRTAWELRYGKTFNRKVCRFGEHVMFLKVTAEKGLKDRFFHGCWLGLALTSDNVIVSNEQGNVEIARTVRRLPDPLARDVGLFNKIKGTPWHPIVREAVPRVHIDAPPVVVAVDLPLFLRVLVRLVCRIVCTLEDTLS